MSENVYTHYMLVCTRMRIVCVYMRHELSSLMSYKFYVEYSSPFSLSPLYLHFFFSLSSRQIALVALALDPRTHVLRIRNDMKAVRSDKSINLKWKKSEGEGEEEEGKEKRKGEMGNKDRRNRRKSYDALQQTTY